MNMNENTGMLNTNDSMYEIIFMRINKYGVNDISYQKSLCEKEQ